MSDETREQPEAELSVVIASYLEAVDEGRAPNPDELVARHPHLAAELRSFLALDGRLAAVASLHPRRNTAETLSLSAARTIARGDLPEAGAAFGAYDLLELVGEGGMGVVFKARHRELGRVVALKLVLAGRLARPSDLERFWIEARAAARLSDEGIVRLYEVGNHDGLPFIVSEFCPAGSLDKKLGRKPVPPEEAARIVAGLAAAVQKAHDADIVHRDLKPANVLVTADGRYKIGDFGLAKLLDEAGTLSATNAILGSPPYMSPEQAEGRGRLVGKASDVYSLGAILYELLTGEPPFRGATPTETLLQVVRELPVPPRRINSSIPRDLETICLRCLEKSPALRFATAQDLADELSRFLRGEPLITRPVGRIGRGFRWCKRNPVIAGLMAIVVLVSLTGAAVSAQFALHASEQAASATAHADAATKLAGEKDEIATREAAARQAAERQTKEARWHLYVARMFPLTDAWERRDFGQLERLLQESVPQAGEPDYRGWEWYYLRDQVRQASTPLRGDKDTGRKPDRNASWCGKTGRVAVVNAAGEIELWVPGHDKPERALHAGNEAASFVTWSPDGKRIACACPQSIIIWDVGSGRELHRLAGTANKAALAWSPDGRRLASGVVAGTITIWDTQKGSVIRRIEPSRNDANFTACLSWHPDSVRLAAACRVGSCHVWDTNTGKHLFVRANTPSGTPLASVAWSPDGKMLAAGSFPNAIILNESGRILRTLPVSTEVLAMDWSPDSRHLATGGTDHSVRVWDPATGRERHQFRVHDRPVRFVSWSPDGKRILSGADATRICDLENTSPQSWRVRISTRDLMDVVWSPDSRQLAIGGSNPPVPILDAVTGRRVLTLEHHNLWSLALSPRGDQLVTLNYHGEAIVWDMKTGLRLQLISDPTFGQPSNCNVSWSPDGKWVTMSSLNGNTVLWDPTAWQPLGRFVSPNNPYWSAAWSPDSRYIAFRPRGGVAIWDITKRKHIARAVLAQVTANPTWSPDGTLVAVGTSQGEIVFIRPATGQVLHTARGHKGQVTRVQWSPDGRRLASASGDETVRIWDAATAVNLLTLPCADGTVQGLAWSPDGRRLAAVGWNGYLHVWGSPECEPLAGGDHLEAGVLAAARRPFDPSTESVPHVFGPDQWIPHQLSLLPVAPAPRPAGTPFPVEPLELRRWRGHTGTVRDITVSTDGKLAVSCAGWPKGDGTIRVWDVATGKQLRQLSGHKGDLSAVRFVGNGHTVLGAGFDRVMRMWDADTGLLLHEFPPHPDLIHALDITPDGLTAVTVGQSRTVWAWNPEEQTRSKTWRVPAQPTPSQRLLAAAVSADGKRVFVGGDVGEVLHIELETGKILKRFHHGAGIEAAALSRDGKFAVSVGFDGRVVQWDIASGKLVREFKGHSKGVQDVSFSPDGKLMVTAGRDGTVRLWDFATGKELHSYRSHAEPVWTARFTPDGRQILAGGGEGGDFDIRVLAVPLELANP